jgi:hypothetical protein
MYPESDTREIGVVERWGEIMRSEEVSRSRQLLGWFGLLAFKIR